MQSVSYRPGCSVSCCVRVRVRVSCRVALCACACACACASCRVQRVRVRVCRVCCDASAWWRKRVDGDGGGGGNEDYDEGRYLFCAGFGEEPHQTVDLQHEEALLALLDEKASLPLLHPIHS